MLKTEILKSGLIHPLILDGQCCFYVSVFPSEFRYLIKKRIQGGGAQQMVSCHCIVLAKSYHYINIDCI